MIINNLNVILETDDLQHQISNIADKVDKIKELTVLLENNVVVLSGKIAVGFAIPFSTKWKASLLEDGCGLCLTLSGVNVGMVGMGVEMISNQLLSLLKSQLEGYATVSVAGKDIVVDLKQVLASRGITLNLPVQSIEITPTGIELVV